MRCAIKGNHVDALKPERRWNTRYVCPPKVPRACGPTQAQKFDGGDVECVQSFKYINSLKKNCILKYFLFVVYTKLGDFQVKFPLYRKLDIFNRIIVSSFLVR